MDFYRFRLPGFERPYARRPRSRGLIVVIDTTKKPSFQREESAAEITELARSAGTQILGTIYAYIPHPSPSHFLREGKLHEVYQAAARLGANVLILSIDLSPTQAGNIERFTKLPVMDRTGLILEIFGNRAQSNEGRLQVELAQLEYALPRLSGLGTVMSRLGGGVGTRGPGEKELERDRRKVRRMIQQVKKRIENVRQHRALLRAGRKRKQFMTIALVGYTNAGKSMLLNALTGSSALVEDKMFATLDPKVRIQAMNGERNLLFVDTVGFLKDLPHKLIQSFHATLEEASHADFLIHVLDIANENFASLKLEVEKVLKEINAAEKPMILALNKADLVSDSYAQHVQKLFPDGVLISAKKKWGLNHLLFRVHDLAKAVRHQFI
ncbi:MAG: GTPase HflX [Candidatus Omnitrophica bacterium CG11_big_fil_rev_8_21_14_0_20_45_26]|uniref:GTPase HflX n=1 Tax=Candidatus Abzuiibacterium crystallinum TaxID=1974748 RepID=A0A2H0LL13_9BACT|nr:MAG: GTPase HflX [Candidatus Omnitrophica bacterium CG11_big_fil_rev_8_21_14_0_20_45_26]PIW63876.1 MAG: GTPase HflX [Candidatus Omnitrophica bacterium CG12_big_fil_rev_8_21_14_0_65_45_16]